MAGAALHPSFRDKAVRHPHPQSATQIKGFGVSLFLSTQKRHGNRQVLPETAECVFNKTRWLVDTVTPSDSGLGPVAAGRPWGGGDFCRAGWGSGPPPPQGGARAIPAAGGAAQPPAIRHQPPLQRGWKK